MKTILLKLSGELLAAPKDGAKHLFALIDQIKHLKDTHRFAIVIGSGNIFRGRSAPKEFGLPQPVADSIGMLATVMNGIILQQCFTDHGVTAIALSALSLPTLLPPISHLTIALAQEEERCIIFCGGTGNPYFTTDTTAVLRALQIGATEVWKATTVDYVYDGDPKLDKTCKPLHQITYQEVIQKQLKIMDLTAITLAQQHNVKIRVFNAFAPQALEEVARTPTFGSTIL